MIILDAADLAIIETHPHTSELERQLVTEIKRLRKEGLVATGRMADRILELEEECEDLQGQVYDLEDELESLAAGGGEEQ